LLLGGREQLAVHSRFRNRDVQNARENAVDRDSARGSDHAARQFTPRLAKAGSANLLQLSANGDLVAQRAVGVRFALHMREIVFETRFGEEG